ncbi:hypothetical protein Q7P37_011519 [Cladosporium fusiforme]
MKQFIGAAAALLYTTASASQLEARGLCDNAVNDGGNWYCSMVEAITYNGVGAENKYNKITKMDGDSGSCESKPFGYSGAMSPLDEEVSIHVRGPAKLKQFAVYTPGSKSDNKARRSATARRHAHAHAHAHKREADANVGDMVYATIDGKAVSWANDYNGQATASPDAATTPAPDVKAQAYGGSDFGSSPSTSAASSSAASSSSSSSSSGSGIIDDILGGSSSSGGDWGRQAYYNSKKGDADGLVFLNHNGGSGSGVFDYSFGNSLSYARADGKGGSSSPEVLEDCELASEDEIIIMTDKECEGDSCGYCRPGTVAHHGFAGPNKAFFFEFQMPDDGKTGANKYDPVNMPAIWMLNAQIPRTLQYGNSDCSCWTSGCGEFDIFEVLAPGDKRMKSTLHGNNQGGSSDYFTRPCDNTIKAAMVMKDNDIHIKILDDDYEFGTSMDSKTIDDIVGNKNLLDQLASVFDLSGHN